jgi:hypothetical protein
VEFLTSSLSHPGGVIEYAGGFLSQLYYFSWLGALIITAVAFSLYLAARVLIKLSEGGAPKIICYIPAIMLLIMYSRYDGQFTVFLSLSAALWFSVVYEKVTIRSSAARGAIFLIEFCLLYYIAGGVSFVFALLAAIYEIFVGRRRILSVLFLMTAIGTILAPGYIFDLQTEITFLPLLLARLRYDWWVINIVIFIYFFFPLVLFTGGAGRWLYRKRSSAIKSQKRAKHKSSTARNPWRFFQNNKVKWAIKTTLPTAILVISTFVSFDGMKKKLVQMDYFACNEMWPEVLQTARRIRPESLGIFCIHDINRALYYTGRLGDEMFCYPQWLPALLLTSVSPKELSAMKFMKTSKLLFELGHIGGAEKDAFELMEVIGNTPLILEQLAKIKMVKGQVEAAKVFLSALSKDLIFGNRGREMLRRLEGDPELANDKTIQHIRSVATEKESVHSQLVADAFFNQLLDKNKNNKMAFEYMMAFYLLTGQTGKIVENIGYLNEMGYERLPQHYEEAIAIYHIMASGGKNMDLHGWTLRPETISRGVEFSRLYNLNGGDYNKENARNALVSNFGKSYFFYFIFELPKVTTRSGGS